MQLVKTAVRRRLIQHLTFIALAAGSAAAAPDQASDAREDPQPDPNTSEIQRKGMRVEFSATPANPERQAVLGGEFADIQFRITGAEDGAPLRRVYPGVWIDLTQTAEGEKPGVSLDCKARVSQYLQGLVGMRPMIDLNSYFVMVLNQDASISVIDPVVGITGITSLYTSIPLSRPGADWTKTSDEKRMFVSMPRAGQIAVVDLDTFKVAKNLDAGEMPTRVVLQPDEKYLWVGNDADANEVGGVTVLDTASGRTLATFETGRGHHEIAFSDDSRTAFLTNRQSGNLSVIDTATLELITDIEIGPTPISLAFSSLSKSLYVADGQSGEVVVISALARQEVGRIHASPGLGPIQFSQDGRWGFLVNPGANTVYVIDAATNTIGQTIPIAHGPFQIGITETFAYIRALDTERVSMINLQELNRGGDVIVNEFAAGSFPPGQIKDISIAPSLVPAAQDAAVLVVSPADATVYYYMEGMNAPMGAFRNYGHLPRAVQIANRALKETEPGVYGATVRLPIAGTFEVAFLNETPEFLHCFTMQAEHNPFLKATHKPAEIEYLAHERTVTAGETMKLRFRLRDPSNNELLGDLTDVRVKYYRAPRFDLTELFARSVGDGIYEVDLAFKRAGAYYIYVAAPSVNAGYDSLRYLTVMARRAVAASEATGGTP